jgi:hypothetical protein
MRKFIINYSDGALSIVTVLDGSTNAEIIAKSPKYQANTSYRDIVDADIPDTYTDMRAAWEDTQPGNQVDINHQKAKDACLAHLRAERDAELHRLDALKVRADELGDTVAAASILADKTTLRDCTEPLKAVDGTGHNDTTKLDDIRSKTQLPAINN